MADGAGLRASIGTVGDSYDNAQAESLIGLYKTECIHREGPWRSVEQVELATCSWADWFNTNRLHSSIGYATPMEYEEAFHATPDELHLEPDRVEDDHHHAEPHEHQLAG